MKKVLAIMAINPEFV